MPLRRLGPDRGDTLAGPVMISDYRTGAGNEKLDFGPMNWRIRSGMPPLDFTGAQTTFEIDVPLMEDSTNPGANIIPVGDTKISRAVVYVPRAGRLLSATLVGEDTLAVSDTNYVTFSITNKLGAGSGSTAMLAASDANTTKSTGGAAITAFVPRALTVSATAAALRVAAGDVLVITSTTAGTLANVVDVPRVKLVFATIPYDLTPLIARTAGSPLVGPVDAVANGEITAALSATNEVNTAGFYAGDKLDFISTYGPVLRARVKLGAIGSNERAILGFASAYSATWDNIAKNAWFRWEGSLATLVEADDATTDTDDTAYLTAGLTLTADTYYWFTIDLTDPGAIRSPVDDYPIKTVAASALAATDFLQPVLLVQKASGTGTPSWTCDFFQAGHAARA